ncbi:MAG: ExbD/TolR family protein [Holosporales bacterium]|jgi:biopolymer transport protein TolR|nr:ExbD/TolR family protein [Holosporales bacterium]
MSVRNNRRQKSQVYINIAPLVEVMLVVIIIFMVTAPMLNVSVQVNLPQTRAASLAETKDAPIIISIDKDSKIYVEEANVTLDELIRKLPIILENGKSDVVYIRGDKDLQYGVIMKIMGVISSAGVCKVSLISEIDSSNSSSASNGDLKQKLKTPLERKKIDEKGM